MAMPKSPPAATPLTGEETVPLIQQGKRVLAKAADLKGLKGDKGDGSTVPGPASTVPGPPGKSAYEIAKAAGYTGTEAQWIASLKGEPGAPGAPLRVETYTATSNASGVATFAFSPAFTAAPTVLIRSGWNNDQYVGGGVTSTTLTGCTVLVKRSRGTLLLTTGPFETAPSGVSVSVVVIGR